MGQNESAPSSSVEQPRRRRIAATTEVEQPYFLMFGGPSIGASTALFDPLIFLQHTQQRSTTPPEVRQTVTLKNDLNLLKRSLKLIPKQTMDNQTLYTIEFEFDSTIDCEVIIHVVGLERRDPNFNYLKIKSGNYTTIPHCRFQAGIGQTFSLPMEHSIDLTHIPLDQLKYDENVDAFRYPIVVELRSINHYSSFDEIERSESEGKLKYQFTYASLLQNTDGTFGLKVLKQKIQMNGAVYELAEIYGVDGAVESAAQGGDENDGGEESLCVICMTEQADTSLIPCRHMCLCFDCSKSLRVQTNKCPLCRTKIHSIIQIPREALHTSVDLSAATTVTETTSALGDHSTGAILADQPRSISRGSLVHDE